MKNHVNYFFLAVAGTLLVFGLLFLSTLSSISSLQIFGNTNYYLFHQLIAVAIGLVLGLILFKIPLHFLKKIAPILFGLNLLALFIVFIPVLGTNFFGASRWISIGNATFQPSEFFKFTAIVYLAAWLANRFSPSHKKGWMHGVKKGYENLTKIFVPFLIFLAVIVVIFYLQKDVSTLGIITISLLVVYFAAGTPLWNTLLVILGGAGSALILVLTEPYRFQRLFTFLHPEQDPLGKGLQLKQSLIALGSGGWFGKGLGMSTQKFGFLPQAMSDSIFAILGEETGIIGCLVIIALFGAFLYLGLKIARNSTNTFASLAAVGITTWICLQATINIASAMGLFPLSGIPLPFFSYGGSHMIAELMGVGLLLNISKNG